MPKAANFAAFLLENSTFYNSALCGCKISQTFLAKQISVLRRAGRHLFYFAANFPYRLYFCLPTGYTVTIFCWQTNGRKLYVHQSCFFPARPFWPQSRSGIFFWAVGRGNRAAPCIPFSPPQCFTGTLCHNWHGKCGAKRTALRRSLQRKGALPGRAEFSRQCLLLSHSFAPKGKPCPA